MTLKVRMKYGIDTLLITFPTIATRKTTTRINISRFWFPFTSITGVARTAQTCEIADAVNTSSRIFAWSQCGVAFVDIHFAVLTGKPRSTFTRRARLEEASHFLDNARSAVVAAHTRAQISFHRRLAVESLITVFADALVLRLKERRARVFNASPAQTRIG